MRDIENGLNNLIMCKIDERVGANIAIHPPQLQAQRVQLGVNVGLLWFAIRTQDLVQDPLGTWVIRNVSGRLPPFVQARPAFNSIVQVTRTDQQHPQNLPGPSNTSLRPGQNQLQAHIHQPQSTHTLSAILEPSPMSLEPAHDSPSNHSQDSSSDDSSTNLEEEVETPVLDPPQSIPFPNPMFDMPD